MLDIIGFTLSTIGKILIAVMAIMVHSRMRKNKKFDKNLDIVIYQEELYGTLGIACIIIGYLFQLPGKF